MMTSTTGVVDTTVHTPYGTFRISVDHASNAQSQTTIATVPVNWCTTLEENLEDIDKRQLRLAAAARSREAAAEMARLNRVKRFDPRALACKERGYKQASRRPNYRGNR